MNPKKTRTENCRNVLEGQWGALLADNDLEMRVRVARNKHTPGGVLLRLSHDSDWEVRYAVAKNRHTPAAALNSLLQDEDWLVQRAALGRRDSLEKGQANGNTRQKAKAVV